MLSAVVVFSCWKQPSEVGYIIVIKEWTRRAAVLMWDVRPPTSTVTSPPPTWNEIRDRIHAFRIFLNQVLTLPSTAAWSYHLFPIFYFLVLVRPGEMCHQFLVLSSQKSWCGLLLLLQPVCLKAQFKLWTINVKIWFLQSAYLLYLSTQRTLHNFPHSHKHTQLLSI